MADDDGLERSGRMVGKGGLALMLPISMAAMPIAGFFLGKLAGDWVGWGGLKFVGLILGIIGGIRESMNIISRLNAKDAPPAPKAGPKP